MRRLRFSLAEVVEESRTGCPSCLLGFSPGADAAVRGVAGAKIGTPRRWRGTPSRLSPASQVLLAIAAAPWCWLELGAEKVAGRRRGDGYGLCGGAALRWRQAGAGEEGGAGGCACASARLPRAPAAIAAVRPGHGRAPMPGAPPRTRVHRSPTSAARAPPPASPRPILGAAGIAQIRDASGAVAMARVLRALGEAEPVPRVRPLREALDPATA